MSFPRYEKYKDSGVEWLGEVPKGWGVMPLKHLVSTPVTDGPHETPNFIDDGVLFISAEAVSSGKIDFTKAKYVSRKEHNRFSKKYRPQKYDIYMVKSGATTGVTAILETDDEFNIWSPLAVIRCGKNHHPYFVLFSMRSRSFQESVVLHWSFGTQQNIGMSVIENLPIANPPIEEQTQIARFLDYETARIDALIGEQQRLIDLLKEKQQAVISHAVTKGLDPTVPMKDSGVEWLGEVPEHWPIHLLKRAFKSVDYGISNSLDSEGNIAILRMGNIGNGKVIKDDLKYTHSVEPELFLVSGDLLYNRTNSLDQIGKVGIFYDDGLIYSFASYLVRLRVKNGSTSEYFAYLLNTDFILSIARSSAFVAIGQCNLNPSRYGYIKVAVPPRNEQVRIVKHLDKHTAVINELMDQANEGIYFLQERRSALISAAVTGKIDVRGWQPPACSSSNAQPGPLLEAAHGR
ncbi:MAG: restriction endonuclease subunit S [Phormidesmis sp.]